MLNSNQVQLGNVIKTQEGTFRVIGGAYGSVESYYLLDVDALKWSRKANSIDELLESIEIISVHGVVAMDYTITLNEDEPEVGAFFVALVFDEDGEAEMELRQIIGSVDEDKFFAIDPVTGARKTRTKDSIEEVIDAYDKVLSL